MKKITLFILAIFSVGLIQAQVGVNTTTPNVETIMEIFSDTAGVLLPRVTTANRDAEMSPNGVKPTGSQLQTGTLIFNTTSKSFQFWEDTNTVSVAPAGRWSNLAVAAGGTQGNDGVVKANLSVTLPTPATTDPGYILLQQVGSNVGNSGGGNVAKWYTLDVDPGEFTLSAPPTTSWPENEPNPVITSFWRDNAFVVPSTAGSGGLIGGNGDSFRENSVPGQIHVWRINIYNSSGSSSSTAISLRLRNPLSGFTTSAVTLFSPSAGTELQTAIFYTIADGASLPAPNGTGNGYVLEFRSGSGNYAIWVESVTRVSLFKD